LYQHSDHFNGKIFLNPVPTDVMVKGSFGRVLRQYLKGHSGRVPAKPLGPFSIDEKIYDEGPAGDVRVTWLGHSSTLIEVDGCRLLTDPLWYNRVSPFTKVGPKRFFANPLPLDQLPKIDYILLSHDHYDHMDKSSLLNLTKRNIPVITMLGVGQRLIRWGVPKELVTELDWWQSVPLQNDLTVTAAPARHFSGRWLTDRFRTLWGAFAIAGPHHKVFFGGDSGYFEGFKEIGERLGPFSVTMLEIGAYNQEWESIHMGPENAVQAHVDLNGTLLMPLHWATFNLALHPWKEPVIRLIREAQNRNVSLLLPAPGQAREWSNGALNSEWWKQYE
jgi:L-ascorbate metabolism protein UlaG (beta-lactamase superfamily)